MLRKYIFTGVFLAMNFNAFSYFDIEEFFSFDREMCGVKMITEQQRNKARVVSFFNKEGFLLCKNYYHRNKKRADYRYEYSVSDTLLEIKEKDFRYLNNTPEEGYRLYKYYYGFFKQCYRVETYLSKDIESPAGVATNFIYQNNLLQSYELHNFSQDEGDFNKYAYAYNDNQYTKLFYTYEDSIRMDSDVSKSVSIYENGKLTDFIREAPKGQAIVSGEVGWDKSVNKVHIRYSNFDKGGNWTRSYFITEKGRVFRSKRKIEYW